MTTWICVTCNNNCVREDYSDDEEDFEYQGQYCLYMDDYTEWEREDDPEDDQEDDPEDDQEVDE